MSSSPDSNAFRFLGIRFWNGSTDSLLREMDLLGGVLTVPSAPSLAQAGRDRTLLHAYRSSRWAVVDGGYIALILRFVCWRSARRISGRQLIERLFADEELAVPMRERTILWVVPNPAEEERIHPFLLRQGFRDEKQFYYHAPFYRTDDEFLDRGLLARVADEKPDWLIICIGGGRQEKLAYWLAREAAATGTPKKPAILCTGAAIAFFTGSQATIPRWADRLYLGWLFRIFENPRLYIPRYFGACWQLPLMLWRFRKELREPTSGVDGPSRKNSASTSESK